MLLWLSSFLCIFVKSIEDIKTLNLELNVWAIMDNTMNLFSSDFPLNVVFNVIVQPQCTFLWSTVHNPKTTQCTIPNTQSTKFTLCTYLWSACRHCVVIPYRAIKNLILIYRGLSEQIYKKSPSAILIQLTCTAMITNKAKLTTQHWVHCVPSHEMIFCSKCAWLDLPVRVWMMCCDLWGRRPLCDWMFC